MAPESKVTSLLVPKLRLGRLPSETLFRVRHETEYPGIRSQTEFGNEWNEWTSGDSQRQSGNADFFPSRWRMHIGEPFRAQGLGQHLRVDRVAVN